MLGCWLQHQAMYGKEAKGVWFRRSIPEIEGAQAEMLKVFPLVGAQYESAKRTWTFTTGATLKLRYLESDQDAYRYQGHEYTLLMYDDVGTWPSPVPIDFLRGTLRSAAGVPCRMISSANPAGPGHEWLKARYLTPSRPLMPFMHEEKGKPGIERVYIPSTIKDNPYLSPNTEAGKQYLTQLHHAGPAHIVSAWIDGDWDIEPGGAMLEPAWLEHTYDTPFQRSAGRVVISIDPAEDIGRNNDETGIVIGQQVGHYVHVLHADACKLLLAPLEERIEQLAKTYQPDLILVEKKSVGGPLVQNLRRRIAWRWATQALDPGRLSKAERMWEQAPWFQGGRVLMPKSAPWLYDYRRELLRFTGNKRLNERDNRVDATSQLLRYFGAGHAALALLSA
jgi:predicted phage terminase large subunit-like protein